MDIQQLVGRNLRRLRLERGLSQEALAYEARIAPSFLSQIENGKRSPTVTTLDLLAKAMKSPITEFFSEQKHSSSQVRSLPRGRHGGRGRIR